MSSDKFLIEFTEIYLSCMFGIGRFAANFKCDGIKCGEEAPMKMQSENGFNVKINAHILLVCALSNRIF